MSEVAQRALTYLAQHHVMTLATTGADGVWAAAVFYASHRFTLYFLSAAHTRHGRHLAENPQVAATIQEDYRDWPGIKGIQIAGEVQRLTGDERKDAIALYQQKYPFLETADSQVRTALTRVNWYRLQPSQLYFIDNSRGLGHRDEIDLTS